MTQLQAGEMAPDFKSTTQDGEPLTLADLRGQRTILYFYPKDNTSGCTLEAKSLRDGKAELTRMGFRIIGVSPDSEKSHRSFCDKHDLNFTLLSDTDHSVCEAGLFPLRPAWSVWHNSAPAIRHLVPRQPRISDMPTVQHPRRAYLQGCYRTRRFRRVGV